jgi:hypothetical protein
MRNVKFCKKLAVSFFFLTNFAWQKLAQKRQFLNKIAQNFMTGLCMVVDSKNMRYGLYGVGLNPRQLISPEICSS